MEKWFPKAEEKLQESTLSSIINGVILIPENGLSGKNTSLRYKPGAGAKVYLLPEDASYIEIIQFWNNFEQVAITDENGEFTFASTLNGTSYVFIVDADNDLRWDMIRTDIVSGKQSSQDFKCYLRDKNKNSDVVLTTFLDKSKYVIGDKIKIYLGGYSPEPIAIHIEIWDEKTGIGKYIWASKEYIVDSSIALEFEALIPVSWPSTASDSKPEYVVYTHFNNALLSGIPFTLGGKNSGDNIAPDNGVISINQGDVYTRTIAVSLGLTCESAIQSLISNSVDFKNAQWEPFTKIKSWHLYNGIEGDRTVYIKFMDDAGNHSEVYNDTIFYKNSPPQGGQITINNSDQYTTSINVNLILFAHDATEMIVSNNSLFTGEVWESYADTKSWNLLTGDGLKTVYTKFKDIAGNENTIASDSILLDSTAVISSLTEDTSGVKKTWNDSIHFILDAGEKRGTASVDIGNVHTGIKLFDNGNNGDSISNDGVYELDYAIQVVDDTFGIVVDLNGNFTDEWGNVAVQKVVPNALNIEMNKKSGVISSDTLWQSSGTPYIIDGPLTINNGANLSIEAGVQLKFVTTGYIQVDGSLDAMGIKNSAVIFLGTEKTGSAIKASVGALILLKYCELRDFYDAVYLNSSPDYSSGSCQISDSRIHDNSNSAVYSNFKELKITYSNLYYNHYGLDLDFVETLFVSDSGIIGNYIDGIISDIGTTSAMTIENNNFYENDSYHLRLQTTPDNFTAESNWWGTENSVTIDGKLYDKNDDSQIGKIVYFPFLSEQVLQYGPR